MGVLVFDFGNFRGKWYAPLTNEKGAFFHAVVPLSARQYDEAVGRDSHARGLLCMNGQGYVIGDLALRHSIRERPRGAARYTRGYYGAALALALVDAFPQGDKNVTLVASNPPGDYDFVDALIDAARGDWQIEHAGRKVSYWIDEVIPFDEPIGGYSHVTLTKNGDERARNPFREKTTLVVDIGGYTTDAVPVDPGGEIDYVGAFSSRDAGTLKILRQFEDDLRKLYRDKFQEVGALDMRRIEAAIRTGRFQFGRYELDCWTLADEAIQMLVNDVRQVIMAAGGIANYDSMILTGGGAALIGDALLEALPDVEFVLAETSPDLLQYANVLGGAKLYALITRLRSSDK